jgi:hypothetical protein
MFVLHNVNKISQCVKNARTTVFFMGICLKYICRTGSQPTQVPPRSLSPIIWDLKDNTLRTGSLPSNDLWEWVDRRDLCSVREF